MNDKQQYQLEGRRKPHGIQLWGVADGQPEGSNGGFLTSGQGYTPDDILAVLRFMYERENGYPGLYKENK